MSALFILPNLAIPESEFEFRFTRSSGPGGQNVNKVSSKAILRWNIINSPSLPASVRARFLLLFKTRLTKEGAVLIASDRYRDQSRNQEDCREKLRAMLLIAATPPKPRKKTKPSKSSLERRHKLKKKLGEKKRLRTKKDWD